MSITLCERTTPTVVSSPQTGRFVAAYHTPCRSMATQTKFISPPHPNEKAFQVEVCDEHANEIVTYEPLDEDSVYSFCSDCRSYADTSGNCGCP